MVLRIMGGDEMSSLVFQPCAPRKAESISLLIASRLMHILGITGEEPLA